jgi:hypothetical protein
MGMLSRLAARHAAARNGVNLDAPEWVEIVVTPQSEEPIRPQILPAGEPEHPARCCDGRHGPACLDGLPPERYPLCGPINPGMPPIRTEGRDHR